jgi:two-component system, NarL family, sensor histidine kinase DesK
MESVIDQVALKNKYKFHSHRWIPLIWLPWFAFFFVQPVTEHASSKVWAEDGVAAVIFLFLFFATYWSRYSRAIFYALGMLVLGIIVAPINGGAATFFIYAAASLPFLSRRLLKTVLLINLVVVSAFLETLLLHIGWEFFTYAGGFAAVIGAGNIFFAERNRALAKLQVANKEVEHLAKVAERERIARDLHDVLGHTLSIIILKSELAGKLIDRDPERAKAEIADVEQTSRTALAEVRNTIRGYRSTSLEEELKQAQATLETAGVTVNAQTSFVGLSPAEESVLALVVREAVTNVVRHAQAHHCRLHLSPADGICQLEIHDDGRGGPQTEGNGIVGMRERIEALGGTLVRDTTSGTRLKIQFPLKTANANGAY